jgi:hypothetical protein
MKTTIIETLLLLLIIVSGGILYTLDKNTYGDNTIHPNKEITCKMILGIADYNRPTKIQNMLKEHPGKRIILNANGTFCFQ